MKTFRIAVDYRVCGLIDIEAEDFEDAIKKAYNRTTMNVYDKEYIDDSWIVNKEMSEYFAKEDE